MFPATVDVTAVAAAAADALNLKTIQIKIERKGVVRVKFVCYRIVGLLLQVFFSRFRYLFIVCMFFL